MKDAFDGLIRRQETTEPQASELEEMTGEPPKLNSRENTAKKLEQNTVGQLRKL